MKKKYSWSLAIFVLASVIVLFASKSVYLADKPTVATMSALADDSKATLKGSIKESGGRDIDQYGFKWGFNKSLGETQIISGQATEGKDFSLTIKNLQAGNTYYYQAFAVNAKGTAVGEIKSFTVPVKPNIAPMVLITSPEDSLTVTRGEIVKINASATDDQKVEAMAIYINNTKCKSGGTPIQYNWDTGQIDAGEYTIMVNAWDGDTADSKSIAVKVIAPENPVPENNQGTVKVTNYSNNTTTVSRGLSGDSSKYPLISKANGIYGQFRYRNTSGGRIEVDPQWVAENIVTITLPGLNQKVQVHKAAADNFILAFNYIKNGTAMVNGRQVSLLSLIDTMDGTYVTRHVMWDPSRGLSNHSWGTAIDINAAGHFNHVDPQSDPNDPNLILWEKAFKPAGFSWGNSYSDSMHYELLK